MPDFYALRERLRLTQAEAAQLFKVSRATWSNWETKRFTAPGPARILATMFLERPELAGKLMDERRTK